MRYFVIGQDGSKYGPADVPTLHNWMAEGRMHADTWLEEEGTGSRLLAKTVLGQGQPTPPPSGYNAPPPGSPYPRSGMGAPSTDNGQTQFIIGWVCAVISLCFCPLGFGAAAIILGVLAKQKGHKHGTVLIVAAVVMMLIGFIMGFVMLANNPDFMRLFGR